MLKIRSFLRLIKDSIRNFVIKIIKRYNRHMAATAYALSAIILVFYFGNLVGFQVNPSEVKADAATYEETNKDSEETNLSEKQNSDLQEYALNSLDHNILLDLTTETENMVAMRATEGIFTEIFPLGQLLISPAVIHYNDVITSMAILTTQNSAHLEQEAQTELELFSTKMDTENQEEEAKETLASTETSASGSLTLETNRNMIKTLSKDELDVLYRIVEAEATGEDVYGKILVANVVLNRVNDSEFPDSVSEVVFQKVGSAYQFSPTKDGRYYSVKVTKTTKEAVKRALAGEDYSQGALYFFARKLTTEKKASWFDRSLRKVVQYGCHEFYANK